MAYRYFFRAFPEAAVTFKLTRAAALDRAREFAQGQGASLGAYRPSIVFGADENVKTYLEREVGNEQANRLMASEVSVLYWDARFFKPLQKEEFRVHVDPGGRITGYEHQLEESAPGARLERAEALAQAEMFLRDTLRIPLGTYSFLPEEANSVARANRTDWTFTWERTGFRAKDAPYRLRVTLQGDRIGEYEEFLKVPDEWQRSFARLRSGNDFMETLALIPYALLLGAALSVMVSLGRRGLVRWPDALKLGTFITALYFAMQMNQLPLTLAGYDTNGSYSSFFLTQIAGAIVTSMLLALLAVIAYVPGEPLYRMDQPARLRFGTMFSFPGLRSKEFFIATVVGLCMAAAHIGYVVLFYVVGKHFGVWAPEDLKYSDTMKHGIALAVSADDWNLCGDQRGISVSHVFGSFRVALHESRFLAIVLPAFAWGFLHSNYPQQPAYIRGIEVGLIGLWPDG